MSPPTTEQLLTYEPFLERLAHSLVRDDDIAKDLVQDTWLKALEHPPHHDGNIKGWLRTVAKRIAFQRVRSRREHQGRDNPDPPAADATNEVDLELVTRAVLELRDPYRDVVLQRFFEGRPPRRIAIELGRPINTVNGQLRRGLALLRERLDKDCPGGRPAWLSGLALFLLRRGSLLEAGRVGPSGRSAGSSAWQRGSPRLFGAAAAAIAIPAGLAAWAMFGGHGPSLTALDLPAGTSVLAQVPAHANLELPTLFGIPSRDRQKRPKTAIEVEPETEREVRVRVVGPGGHSQPGARVLLYIGDRGIDRGRTDAEGELLVSIPEQALGHMGGIEHASKRACLAADVQGLIPSPRYHIVTEPGDETILEIEVGEHAYPLRGRILGHGGAPARRAFVFSPGHHRRLEHVSDTLFVQRINPHTMADHEGRFVLPHVAHGPLQIRAYGHGLVCTDVRFDHADGADELLIRLLPAAVVRGKVTDRTGRGVAGAEVRAQAWSSTDDRKATTDGEGNYQLFGITPGQAVLVAKHPSISGHSDRTVIELAPDERLEWNPRLRPSRTRLAVRLLDSGGRPLEGWEAEFMTPDEGAFAWRRYSETNAAGIVEVSAWPENAVRVQFFDTTEDPERQFPALVVHELRPGVRTHTVRLPRRAPDRFDLEGRLLHADGRPVRRATVRFEHLADGGLRRIPVDSPDGGFHIGRVQNGRLQPSALLHVGFAELAPVTWNEALSERPLELRLPRLGSLEFENSAEDTSYTIHALEPNGSAHQIIGPLYRAEAKHDLLPGRYLVVIRTAGKIVRRGSVSVAAGRVSKLEQAAPKTALHR